ncbi:MAG: flagellar motor protein PomA [Gammaproteobacteria bacterium]|nr:flagellar motor protein PomA [Gammaproteobacteria bacterium]MBT3723472.1 flagellar motor protein PomA [Gammaproteobacteria bacterium]MBT4076614.1 flagellar motor protein PomA [Gammaproteobacteria bacterium]MBT4194320.1 flagellar motor protein PomA [Gammaproteobacteria bacterium]MBT4450874.1 flagellar motor protein PomA [Gammaproteobacteria bacterium]
MDIASLVGIILAFGIIASSIMMGGPFIIFVNVPSILVVVGGTLGATLMRVTLADFLGSFKVGMKGFMYKMDNPATLIEEAVEMANIARKEGLLALEGREISNSFLEKGIGLCIDGHSPEIVNNLLSKDINLTIQRHAKGADMFKAMAVYAPAMGMIGTLIGLVQMLANMSDPAAIGPAMAVALLTTLYGAVIANAFASPLSEKLILIAESEKLNKSLILESISSIQDGTNPRVMQQLLNAFLPENKRPTDD